CDVARRSGPRRHAERARSIVAMEREGPSGASFGDRKELQRHDPAAPPGDADPVGLLTNGDGSQRTREEVMKNVHTMTEAWVLEHREKTLSEVVALGQYVRADTLALLAALGDEQLAERLPGAPCGDGT